MSIRGAGPTLCPPDFIRTGTLQRSTHPTEKNVTTVASPATAPVQTQPQGRSNVEPGEPSVTIVRKSDTSSQSAEKAVPPRQ